MQAHRLLVSECLLTFSSAIKGLAWLERLGWFIGLQADSYFILLVGVLYTSNRMLL